MSNAKSAASNDVKQRRITLGGREIVARGLRGGLSQDIYHASLTVSWPKFIGLTAAAFVALNLAFGILYSLSPDSISNTRPHGWINYFFFSIETMASVGYGDMHPQTPYGHFIASAETFVGLFSVALLTGLIFARFSQPRARILFADRLVISNHDGAPALMLRVANERTNMICDASATLWFMRNIRTAEGATLRRFYEMDLLRRENPMFVLSWGIFHIIDVDSPMFGLSEADLREATAGIVLSISGYDENAAQTVRSRRIYSYDDIVWNHRYCDIIDTSDEDVTVVNYHRIHEIEAVNE